MVSPRKIRPLPPLLKRIRATQPIRRVPLGSGNIGMTWTDGMLILAFGAMCGFLADYGQQLVTVPTIRETKFEYIRIVDEDLTARALAAADARCAGPLEPQQVPGGVTTLGGGYPDAKIPKRVNKWKEYSSGERRSNRR